MPDPGPVAPHPAGNELDAMGQRTRAETARRVVSFHREGLQDRRERDLISEKLLLHIDGSGAFQWADIYRGTRVEIPRHVSEYRKSENLLRPVVDNAVAHHTTMPLRYFADATPDRRARQTALVDTVWANHVAEVQDLNGLFADALYLSTASGFCPVHRYWREDPIDTYEPTSYGQPGPGVGMLDCWLGNPFDTVFDRAAKRNHCYAVSYGRILPARLVREHFAGVPGVSGIEGSTRLPSAAYFQRIAQQWRLEGLTIHGTPVVERRNHYGRDDEEELLYVVCFEVLPGADPQWPDGRLQIVAVPGDTDLRRGQGGQHAVLLADQPLPASDFSWTLFYSHHRGDDILGKPWAEDLDEHQIGLNIALSERWAFVRKMVEAPVIAPGGAISEDMADLDGYSLLEVEPSLASWSPRVLQWPTEALQALDREVADRRRAIYTIGGYQAVSRGESPGSRTAAKAIMALQQADKTIHGPVNQRFRRAAADFMRGCWRQMKTYGDVPWLIEASGDEFAYLLEPYIDRTRLSERPPKYKLVNAFGSTPELRAQELMELIQVRGADGEPFISTAEARRQYPDQLLFDDQAQPKAVARRRAKTVTATCLQVASRFRQQTGFDEWDIAHPWVQRAAMHVFGELETRYPRLRDDDLQAHLEALSEITQDETADPIARLAAMQRQNLYYEWQAQMAMQQAASPSRQSEQAVAR